MQACKHAKRATPANLNALRAYTQQRPPSSLLSSSPPLLLSSSPPLLVSSSPPLLLSPLSTLDRLLALPRYADAGAAAYKPGLDRMRALLDGMGHPEAGFPSVLVGGTNGKGSTASFAAAILTASGRRVGLHTSPHLLSVTERMRVDGRAASADWLEGACERHWPLFQSTEASFFEVTTALSLLYFGETGADVAVVEVGMGGRLDATNVLAPVATAVTNVSLDHTEILGDTIAEIAREKAGIARRDVLFLTTAEGDALAVLRTETARVGAIFEDVRESSCAQIDGTALSIRTPRGHYDRLSMPVAGEHQAWNALLAVRLAETVAEHLPEGAVRAGIGDVAELAGLRGRGQAPTDFPRIVLDVAHNAEGWRAALATADRGVTVLVGVMADKDAGALAELLAKGHHRAMPVDLPSERALDADRLASILESHGVTISPAPRSVEGALEWFESRAPASERLLVIGSHITVAEVMRVLRSRIVSTPAAS